MRVIALIAAYNERRFIATCIDHLHRQGVESYVIDNESTDGTAAIAGAFRGRGLAGLETLPRRGHYCWAELLRRKEELASELEADWFIHLDPDELRLPPAGASTLEGALAGVQQKGFNAVDFSEFVFVPTAESPDHDHGNFVETMRWYYPYAPRPACRVSAWRKQPERVDLVSSAGHGVRFPGLRVCPDLFPMRHYLFLSRAHAVEKYNRTYAPDEIVRGWHGWRILKPGAAFPLPRQADLREYTGDGALDPARPLRRHFLETVFTE